MYVFMYVRTYICMYVRMGISQEGSCNLRQALDLHSEIFRTLARKSKSQKFNSGTDNNFILKY